MHKIMLALTFLLGLFYAGSFATLAHAGENCKTGDATCELFLQQQDRPAYTGPHAQSGPVRCVYVTSNAPTALVLREGVGTTGDPITSWRKNALDWKQTMVGGHSAFLTQVCFSQSIPFNYAALTLCGEVGHSVWRKQHIAFLKRNNVPKGDPACVGGDGWCGFRGL